MAEDKKQTTATDKEVKQPKETKVQDSQAVKKTVDTAKTTSKKEAVKKDSTKPVKEKTPNTTTSKPAVSKEDNAEGAQETKQVKNPKFDKSAKKQDSKSSEFPRRERKQIWEKKANEDERDSKRKGKQRRKQAFKNSFKKGRDKKFEEKVISISRVAKIVKGGRRFSFSAFVVVGDLKGTVGFGHGKANEVPDAIKKAVKDARNNLMRVPIHNKITVPHEIHAKFLSSRVMLKPASKGKGIVASGTVRAVVELAGYTDIYTKTYGSRSKANIVKATFKALKALRRPEEIASIRGKNVSELLA